MQLSKIDKYDNNTSKEYTVAAKKLTGVKKLHDHVLETRGPIGTDGSHTDHKTFTVPFSSKLRKKKKYKKALAKTSKGKPP